MKMRSQHLGRPKQKHAAKKNSSIKIKMLRLALAHVPAPVEGSLACVVVRRPLSNLLAGHNSLQGLLFWEVGAAAVKPPPPKIVGPEDFIDNLPQ